MPERQLTANEESFCKVVKAAGWAPVEAAFGAALDASEINESAKYPAYRALCHNCIANPRDPLGAWDALGQEPQDAMLSALDGLIANDIAAHRKRIEDLEKMKRPEPEAPEPDPPPE